jgi:hypothetical protein
VCPEAAYEHNIPPLVERSCGGLEGLGVYFASCSVAEGYLKTFSLCHRQATLQTQSGKTIKNEDVEKRSGALVKGVGKV